jgi:hypothetical protein
MNAERIELLTIGIAMEGGFYGGRFNIDGREYGLIVSPKKGGDIKGKWHTRYEAIEGASSFCDGLANTHAMAEAGSALAKKALAASIGGHTDWYIKALDESDILYRAFKPTVDENSLYMRSGINLSAVPPTHPYTRQSPAQTIHPAFQAGGEEAFEAEGYWTSTQYASDASLAWGQHFGYGYQTNWDKDTSYRARLVRRIAL